MLLSFEIQDEPHVMYGSVEVSAEILLYAYITFYVYCLYHMFMFYVSRGYQFYLLFIFNM